MGKYIERNAAGFCRIGEALFGRTWQTAMADALLIDSGLQANRKNAVRTVQRWASEERSIPAGVWDELAELCDERAKKLAIIAADLAT